MGNIKERIFTFKADTDLANRLDGIANKSEFIRRALLAALAQDCPLCQGTGILNDQQRRHWEHFLTMHTLERCRECHAVHFVCNDGHRNDLQ